MILEQLLLFAVCFLLGAVCRLAYKGVSKLETYIGLKAITIIFDFFMAGIAVFAFVMLVFILNDGKFMLYMLLSSIAGYAGVSLFF